VLDEMRDTVPLRIFITGAGLNPYADRNGANVLHLFGYDRETVGQHFSPYMSYIIDHRKSPGPVR
jgi:hypothetical protein